MDVSELSIFPANAAQIHESRRRTFSEWGRGLGLEEYIAREEMLDTKPHATDGKMVIWFVIRFHLVYHPETNLLCSIRTHKGYSPPALIQPHSSFLAHAKGT